MSEVRHKELVNNIANMDTPYFKAKDINVSEFREVLSNSIDKRRTDNPWHFNMQSSRDVQGRKSLEPFHMSSIQDLKAGETSTGFAVKKRQDDTVMRHDQNNVSIESELARLGKNNALHKSFVTLARDNFRMIETALRMRM